MFLIWLVSVLVKNLFDFNIKINIWMIFIFYFYRLRKNSIYICRILIILINIDVFLKLVDSVIKDYGLEMLCIFSL